MHHLRINVTRILCLLGIMLFPAAVSAAGSPHAVRVLGRPAHVVLVIEENKSFSTIIGNPDAPYLNQLARQGQLFTDAHAVIHPSQPNYVALFSGSTHGLTDDSCPRDLSGPSLASELLSKKLSFAIYSENLPSVGYAGCSGAGGLYRRMHNPVVDFQAAGLPAALNRPFSDFPADYSKLPALAFVIPNMMNDMHGGTIAAGDVWLKAHLSKYAEWAKTHDSLLIVIWDESDARSATNQIPLMVIGAGITPGHNGQNINHYGVLRMLEGFYSLKPLGNSAGAVPAVLTSRPSGMRR